MAPLSIKQVVFTPSIIAVPKFAQLNHRFLGSLFQNAEGVNCGFVSFWPGLDQPWLYPSEGAGLPWPWLPHPGLTTASYSLLIPLLVSRNPWAVQYTRPNDGPPYRN